MITAIQPKLVSNQEVKPLVAVDVAACGPLSHCRAESPLLCLVPEAVSGVNKHLRRVGITNHHISSPFSGEIRSNEIIGLWQHVAALYDSTSPDVMLDRIQQRRVP